MNIKYITMMKDYKYNKRKGIGRLLNIIEDKLVCAVCAETINNNFTRIKNHDILDTQVNWSLT